jgi:nitronate monooxygenase
MKTRLTQLLHIEHPLIQAPMAGVSTPAMAAAVSNAGALGSVPLGALDATAAREALEATRALTRRPIAANVFVHPTPRTGIGLQADFLTELRAAFEETGASPPETLREIYRSFNDDDEMLHLLLDARPEVVSLHFGVATPERMSELLGAGIKVLATATSVAEAQVLAESGVQGIILQSWDAGGHSGAFLGGPDPRTEGQRGLLELLRATLAVVNTPVVAAGGLMDGHSIRKAMEVGADGAQLGTAFVGCPESLAGDAYRAALAAGSATRLTASISGRPARGLDNALMNWARSVQARPPDYPLTYDGVKQLIAARKDPSFSVMWAGSGASQVRCLPASELVKLIAQELG